MTTATHVMFRIHALPAGLLDEVRGGAAEIGGSPVVRVVATGGEPVRCCLRNAAPGADLLLFNYEPPLPASPYREVGAVYVHADPCTDPASPRAYPSDWYGRPQVLRAYDERGWIHPATRVHDGQHPEDVLAEMLTEPGVVQIHSRNIAYGCYMFTVTRNG